VASELLKGNGEKNSIKTKGLLRKRKHQVAMSYRNNSSNHSLKGQSHQILDYILASGKLN
jgi:hypothetical protein